MYTYFYIITNNIYFICKLTIGYLKSSKENGDSKYIKLKKYLGVCEKLKPVFRYYFFEKFLSPSIWFERRQAFIHR